MAVQPSTLQAWSERPISFMLAWTRDVLTETLAGSDRLAGYHYEIFAQGSYANHTNIPESSDVDLIVELKLPFQEDVTRLDGAERKLFDELYEPSPYDWHDFQADVIATVRKRYFVEVSSKCLDIKDWDSLIRLPADVVPALEFRRYSKLRSADREVYESGVFFYDKYGNQVISYPRQHLRNGQDKDRRTRSRFKQIVRVIKKARNALAEDDGMTPVSSYLVECLLFNVPDEVFMQPLPTAFHSVLAWLNDNHEKWTKFKCQNGIHRLFGEAFPDRQPAMDLVRDLRTLCQCAR